MVFASRVSSVTSASAQVLVEDDEPSPGVTLAGGAVDRLFGLQRGVTVARRSQLGRPA